MNDPKTPGKLSKVFRDPPAKRNTSKSASGRGKKKKKKPDLLWLFSLYLLNNPQQYVHVETFTVFFDKLADIVLEYIYT